MARKMSTLSVLATQFLLLFSVAAGEYQLYDPSRYFPTGKGAGTFSPPECSANSGVQKVHVEGNLHTGHWGYFYDGLLPVVTVKSGDVVTVDAPSSAGSWGYEYIVAGDPGHETIFAWDERGPAVQTKGPWGGVEGAHWMTGPIYICGAEPGDVLQVDIQDLVPHPNPGKGNRTWGANFNGPIGWQERAGMKTRGPGEVVTLYEVVTEAGGAAWAEPLYQYRLDTLTTVTSCAPLEGAIPRTTAAGAAEWKNPQGTFRRRPVPCVDGKQTWTNSAGQTVEVPESAKDYSVKGKFRSPVNPHIGNIGLAPGVGATVSTGPPYRTGGNIDDRRLGKGSSLYLPVEVAGGLLSLGDCHAAMGDAELSGTGIETSMDATLKLTLHKAGALPRVLQGLDFPLLENANEYVVHGFTHNDYLRELENPQVDVFDITKSLDLNRAMAVAFNNTRDFMMTAFDLTEDQAVTAMSVGVDFGITQAVDANLGVHAIIPKWMFSPEQWGKEPAYMPRTLPGTSLPAKMVYA